MDGSNPRETRLIGGCASFSRMLEQVSALAPLDKPVLIVGERGTGKELVAARIHYLSGRWQRRYQTLNCAAISETLMESELFGHEAGSFTGAINRHKGRFERAHGGSLFLDELATTSARVQEQLLRVIEYGELERVGGSEVLNTDVRLIAATNEDLPGLAEAGKFRRDLLDRLNFDVITLPPLRCRREDILPLAEHFAANMSRELGRDYFAGFLPSAAQRLLDYSWPGNVRELKNVVERSCYRLQDWREELREVIFDPFESPYRPLPASPAPAQENSPPLEKLLNQKTLPVSLKDWMQAQEREWVALALEENKYNQRKAADSLGLTYHQLRACLRKYSELVAVEELEE